MPRTPRIETSEGLYHVINRGNYRSFIFESDGAKESFLKTLDEACAKFGWELSAYCLMSNHFHLCIATPQGNLSDGMRWLQATYATRFNRFRKESGHLFQGRFKSLIVEPGKHWRDLVDYIHLNPVRAGLVEAAALGKYRWTSLYRFPKRKSRPRYYDCAWMDYDDLLSDTKGGWVRYLNSLSLRASDDPDERAALDRAMCRGWVLGGKEFRKSLAEDLLLKKGEVRLEKDGLDQLNREQWAMLLDRMLECIGKSRKDVEREGKSAAWKKAVACKLRETTAAKSAWLGEALGMGPGRNVNSMCKYYERTARKRCAFAKNLERVF